MHTLPVSAILFAAALALSIFISLFIELLLIQTRPTLAFVASWPGMGISVLSNGLLLSTDITIASRSCFLLVSLIAILSTAVCGMHAFCSFSVQALPADQVEIGIADENMPRSPFSFAPFIAAAAAIRLSFARFAHQPRHRASALSSC